MSQSTITLVLSEKQKEELKKKYAAYCIPANQPYIDFIISLDDVTITAYTSRKVVFQGKQAKIYAKPYLESDDETSLYPQAGSDEVGTGDYFGPVCVCASYVDDKHIEMLKTIGVKDSKALTDEWIVDNATCLEKEIPHSLLVLMPQKYNQVHELLNMNAIKAFLHNQAYVNLSKKIDLPSLKIIDQFVDEDIYYRYLSNEANVIRNIHFETKAENKYLSVAVSSILARYAFLNALEKMKAYYHFTFLKGAGKEVDESAKQFVRQFGKESLAKVAKLHFKNTQKVLC